MDGEVEAGLLLASSVTRSPRTTSTTLTMTNVADDRVAAVAPTATELDAELAGDCRRSGRRPRLDRGGREDAGRDGAPKMPPTPWTAKTSSASSTLMRLAQERGAVAEAAGGEAR